MSGPQTALSSDVASQSNLAHRVEHEFASLVRLRGLKFLQQDRVTADPDPENDAVWLSVIDGATREVLVDWSEIADGDGDELSISCTCGSEMPCKHQWAALLYLDEIDLATSIPGQGKLGLRLEQSSAELGVTARRPPRPWRRTVDALRSVSEATTRRSGASDAHKESVDVFFVLDGDGMRDDTREPGRTPLRIALFERPKRGERRRKVTGEMVPISARLDEIAGQSRSDGVLAMLADLTRRSSTPTWSDATARVEIPHSLLHVVVPELCRGGRLGWWSEAGKDAGLGGFRPVAWDDGEPFRLVLVGDETTREDAASPDDDGHDAGNGGDTGSGSIQLRIAAVLERDSTAEESAVEETESLGPEDLEFLFAGGLALQRHRLVRVADADHVAPWLAQLGTDGLRIDIDQTTAALEAIWQLPDLPELRLPERYRWPVDEADCRPVLTLAEPRGDGAIPGAIRFEYGDFVARPGDARIYWAKPEEHRLVARDLEAERDAVESLRSDRVDLDAGGVASIPAEVFALRSTRWVEDGWRLEVEGKKVRAAVDFQARIASSIDWFDVEGSMSFGSESVALPELLRAARERRRLVELNDGSLGLLPAEWLDRFTGLALVAEAGADSESGTPSGAHETIAGAVRFGAHQSLLLDALLAAGSVAADIRVDETFRKIRSRLAAFEELEPEPTPDGFVGELRPYQQRGPGLAGAPRRPAPRRLPGGRHGPGQDGPGARPRLAAGFHRWQRRPSVAACGAAHPAVELGVGVRRASRPSWRCCTYHGPERAQLLEDLAPETLVVTTYGTLLRRRAASAGDRVRRGGTRRGAGDQERPSQRAKACRLLTARNRLALTGTPVENHLGELWSIFEFLNPALLGRLPALQDHAGKESLAPEAVDAVCPRAASADPAAHQGRGTHRPAGEDGADPLLRPSPRRTTALRATARLLPPDAHARLLGSVRRPVRRQVRGLEDPGPRSVAAAAPGGLPSRPHGRRAQGPDQRQAGGAGGAPAGDHRRGPQVLVLLPVHHHARHRRAAAQDARHGPSNTSTAAPATVSSASTDSRPTTTARIFLISLQRRRTGPQSHRRRLRLLARPLVESRRRVPGHRSHSPHRPDPPGLRLPTDRARHRGGEDPPAPGAQAGAS